MRKIIAVASIGVFILGILVWRSPTGRTSQQSQLKSVYKTSKSFNHFSPAWLIDESIQVRLGGILLPYLDAYTNRQQAKHFSKTFNTFYSELNRSKDFVEVGSALGEAYVDMLFSVKPVGHAYIYHPQTESDSQARYPVIVFMHGWLGNMKPYIWGWSKFSDQHKFVIICPTFRNGVWNGAESQEMVRWVESLIRQDPRCDSERIYVAGLSNGGTGVTQWATTLPNTYRGLIYISPVMAGIESEKFTSAVGSRPILVISGENDNRIPPAYLQENISKMKKIGLNVSSLFYSGTDHILILDSLDRLHSDLLRWIKNATLL